LSDKLFLLFYFFTILSAAVCLSEMPTKKGIVDETQAEDDDDDGEDSDDDGDDGDDGDTQVRTPNKKATTPTVASPRKRGRPPKNKKKHQ
jgi:hypothetical protein